MRTGVLCEGRGGLYTVLEDGGGSFVVRAPKKFRREGISPLVGDRVRFSPGAGETHGWMEEILPRVSVFVRPPVANVTLLCVVVAPEPPPDWLLVDKLLLAAGMQGISAVLAVNKEDLCPSLPGDARHAYRGAGVFVQGVSAARGTGLEALGERMRGSLCCMAGQSGAGKSSLLGALLGKRLDTGELSARLGRGRQTTRHTALLEGRGLRALDTPGFSLLVAPRALDPRELWRYYPEFEALRGRCRFDPCYHMREPDCAVEAAREAGALDGGRLLRYRELMAELESNWEERYG